MKRVEIIHHSTSSTIQVKRTFESEVSQGHYELVTVDDWYEYSEIIDLYLALKEQAEGNLEWLLNKKI